MHLPAMMRLVIEHVEYSIEHGVGVVRTFAVGIRKRFLQKMVIGITEEIFNVGVFTRANGAQFGEIVVQNSC